MSDSKELSQAEVNALREEVKNLASALNTAVERIQELESIKKKAEACLTPESDLTPQEEVQALREEIKNVATALDKAVSRVRELEGD